VQEALRIKRTAAEGWWYISRGFAPSHRRVPGQYRILGPPAVTTTRR